jgi:hypothetical protein
MSQAITATFEVMATGKALVLALAVGIVLAGVLLMVPR